MTTPPEPEEGQKWVRNNTHYEILDVDDGVVTMKDNTQKKVVEETIERFREEAEAERAIHHPECEHCGLPVDPKEGRTSTLHYGCWFEHASVQERCEAESNRPGGLQPIASEALRNGNPKNHLLDVIGDPVRSLKDRNDARALLQGAVSTSELIEAEVMCPNCREGEVFEIHPHTGEVKCHCGEILQSPN